MPRGVGNRNHIGDAVGGEGRVQSSAGDGQRGQQAVAVRLTPPDDQGVAFRRHSVLGQGFDLDRAFLQGGEVHRDRGAGTGTRAAVDRDALEVAAAAPGLDPEALGGVGNFHGVGADTRGEGGPELVAFRQGQAGQGGIGFRLPDGDPVQPGLLVTRNLDRVQHGAGEVVGSHSVFLNDRAAAGNDPDRGFGVERDRGDQAAYESARRHHQNDFLRVRPFDDGSGDVGRQLRVVRRQEDEGFDRAFAAAEHAAATAESGQEHHRRQRGESKLLHVNPLVGMTRNVHPAMRQNQRFLALPVAVLGVRPSWESP